MPTIQPHRFATRQPGSASGATKLLAVVLFIGIAGCAEVDQWEAALYDELPAMPLVEPLAALDAEAPDPEAYEEKIPGTLVTFEMIPLAAGSTGGETSDSASPTGPLWFGRTEVTWDAYDVFVYELDKEGGLAEVDAISRPSKPYVLPGENFGHQGNPALGMTFMAAQEYAKWLSARTSKTYRLPTEEEWEHACRLGQKGAPALEEQAWHWENAEDQAHKVASLAPDALGLHDMLGNAAEWALAADGTPVIKGGAWDDNAEDVDCDARETQTPAWNATDPQLPKSTWWLSDAPFLGFRLVREAGTGEEG